MYMALKETLTQVENWYRTSLFKIKLVVFFTVKWNTFNIIEKSWFVFGPRPSSNIT